MTETTTTSPALAFHGSRLFTAWLTGAQVSLALTTYQAGKLFLIGMCPDGRLSVFERSFERPMGLGVGAGRLWMSALHQLWRFEDFLDPGEARDGHDALYVPVTGHTTGDIEHRLEIGGIVDEIFDVAVLPAVTRPMALGFRTDEIRFTLRPDARQSTPDRLK